MIVFKSSVKELLLLRIIFACICGQSMPVFAEQKIFRDDWYLSQPGDSATIQMSGHGAEIDAIAYIKKEKLSGDIGYYQTQYKGLPWYAVTYGKYRTLDEARAQIKLLPGNLQYYSPWPRTFKAISSIIDIKEQKKRKTADNNYDSEIKPASPKANESIKKLSWEDGQAAYDDGDFMAAYNIWLKLAKQGDELSQFNLGVMYSRGEGIEKSGSNALRWYIKSAEQGYAPAQFNLGAVYLEGKLTKEDAEKAAIWWQKAAEQGFVQAQFNIASLYCRGVGVSRDQNQCKFWYGRAASNGDIHARKILDHLTEIERKQNLESSTAPGSNSDTQKDEMLAPVAAQSLNKEEVSEEKQERSEIRKISAEEQGQLARAQKAFTRNNYVKAHDIWLPLAEAGNAEAQYSLGFLYQSGWGSEQDLLQAVAWYNRAAEQNEARAQFNLGVLLINGEDAVEKDTETGVLWLTRSADGNNSRAKEFLIKAYEEGRYGIEKSPEKSEYWKSR